MIVIIVMIIVIINIIVIIRIIIIIIISTIIHTGGMGAVIIIDITIVMFWYQHGYRGHHPRQCYH